MTQQDERIHGIRATPGIIPALVVVGIGVLFLLNNLNIVYVNDWWRFWPVILVAAGLAKLVDAQSDGGRTAGIVLVMSLCAWSFALWGILHLRRCLSIIPEARRLVTSGPYRLVRHPLYLAEQIAAIGCAMQFWSIGAVILLLVQFGFQLRRMANEERVLERHFPEYTRYRQTTARLIPGIY